MISRKCAVLRHGVPDPLLRTPVNDLAPCAEIVMYNPRGEQDISETRLSSFCNFPRRRSGGGAGLRGVQTCRRLGGGGSSSTD